MSDPDASREHGFAKDRSSFAPSATWEALRFRHRVLRDVRGFFDSRGWVEVQTPTLSSETVSDPQIESFVVMHGCGLGAPRGFLQTSPEYHMKRILAAGATAIYQICPAFRVDEAGPCHNPEFTICEWYRVGDSMHEGIEFLAQLTAEILKKPPTLTITYQQAFQEATGIDPLETSVAALRRSAWGDQGPPSDDLDDWLNFLFATQVQPGLGWATPEVVSLFPASQAALARICPHDPRVAERFELFVNGIELANGFRELTDAEEFRRRFEGGNRARAARRQATIPFAERFFGCLVAGLPSATGVAMGFDRLVMLANGSSSIDRVLAFPSDRA